MIQAFFSFQRCFLFHGVSSLHWEERSTGWMGKAWDGVEGFDRTTLEGVVSASCLSGVLKRKHSCGTLFNVFVDLHNPSQVSSRLLSSTAQQHRGVKPATTSLYIKALGHMVRWYARRREDESRFQEARYCVEISLRVSLPILHPPHTQVCPHTVDE